MTEQDKVVLIQGLDLQISQVIGIVLQSQDAKEKAVGRETIFHLNTLIAKVEALKAEDESK